MASVAEAVHQLLGSGAGARGEGAGKVAEVVQVELGEGHTGPPAPNRDRAEPEIRAVLEADRRFDQVTVRRYDWNQRYTAAEYRKLMRSYSGTQMMDDTDRQGLLDDMEAFINSDFDGAVTRPLVVTLTTARLA